MKKIYQAVLFSESGSFVYSRSLGVHRIATILRETFGWNVLVLDHFTVSQVINDFKNILTNDILTQVLSEETKLVGFSTTFMNISNQWLIDQLSARDNNFIKHPVIKGNVDCLPFINDDDAYEFLKLIKTLAPNSKTVIGGVKAESKKYKNYVDAYVIGYGEGQIVDLVKYWQGKNPFMPVKNLSPTCLEISHDTKGSNFNFSNSATRFLEEDLVLKGEVLPIEISRGCIFKCKFCAYPLNGKKKWDHIKESDCLRDEFLKNYDEHGTTKYIIIDDTFNDSIEKLEMFNDVVQSLPFKIEYGSYIRHDLLNAHRHTIGLLKDSGLVSATFGIETLNYESGKAIGKGLPPEKTIEFLHELRSQWPELITSSGFILGLPHDTKESIESMCRTITDKKFPLDGVTMVPLWLQKTAKFNRLYYSEFEKNWESFGYRFLTENNMEWSNGELTYSYCLNEALKYQTLAREIKRNKVFTFEAMAAMNFGYSCKELKQLSQKEFFTTIVSKRISYTSDYYFRLKKYLNIE